jgi:hypothetical protein
MNGSPVKVSRELVQRLHETLEKQNGIAMLGFINENRHTKYELYNQIEKQMRGYKDII